MCRRNMSGRTVPQTGRASYNKSTVQLALSPLGNLKIVVPTCHGCGLSEPNEVLAFETSNEVDAMI